MKTLSLIFLPVPMFLLAWVAYNNQNDPKTVILCLIGAIIYAILIGILLNRSNLLKSKKIAASDLVDPLLLKFLRRKGYSKRKVLQYLRRRAAITRSLR